jgi:hypothetical protein
MAFNADPHIRIQKWGANFRNNMMDINSDLRGMTRPLTRDIPEVNDYKQWSVKSSVAFTPEETNYVTDDSRATHPAWTYREAQINRFEPPLLNPLDQLEKPFHYDLNTRILERDHFKPTPVKLAVAGTLRSDGQGHSNAGQGQGQGYAPFIKAGKIGSSL